MFDQSRKPSNAALPLAARGGVGDSITIPERGRAERRFKYAILAQAILVLLIIGLFPLVYSLIVSFQNITMMAEDTSFQGLANYARLLSDLRLWKALGHTAVFTAIALPAELILGLAMAYLFLEKMPGRQIFVALLLLPTVISPIVAGATWRLLFDNRYGPINQIIGWLAGAPTPTGDKHPEMPPSCRLCVIATFISSRNTSIPPTDCRSFTITAPRPVL